MKQKMKHPSEMPTLRFELGSEWSCGGACWSIHTHSLLASPINSEKLITMCVNVNLENYKWFYTTLNVAVSVSFCKVSCLIVSTRSDLVADLSAVMWSNLYKTNVSTSSLLHYFFTLPVVVFSHSFKKKPYHSSKDMGKTKEELLKVASEVRGWTKSKSRHQQTWWCNEEVGKIVNEKRLNYKICHRSCGVITTHHRVWY